MAQQSSVAVPATDDSGLPLPGATVVVENTNRGVTTDLTAIFPSTHKTAKYLSSVMSATKTAESPLATKATTTSVCRHQ